MPTLEDLVNDDGKVLRTPAEWCIIESVSIADPDGWRDRDDGVSFDDPITHEDFLERLMDCTIKMLPQ